MKVRNDKNTCDAKPIGFIFQERSRWNDMIFFWQLRNSIRQSTLLKTAIDFIISYRFSQTIIPPLSTQVTGYKYLYFAFSHANKSTELPVELRPIWAKSEHESNHIMFFSISAMTSVHHICYWFTRYRNIFEIASEIRSRYSMYVY